MSTLPEGRLGKCCCPGEDCPDGSTEQIEIILIPQPLVDWFNELAAQYQAHGNSCDGWTPPDAPILTPTDYADTVATALGLIAGVDWSSPPVPWSGNNRYVGGFLATPEGRAIRYQLYAIDGFIDGSHGYAYAWNNENRNTDIDRYYAFAEDIPFSLFQQCDFGPPCTPSPCLPPPPVGVFSGFWWFQQPISKVCIASDPYTGGYPALLMTWSRHCGFPSVCELARAYEWSWDGAILAGYGDWVVASSKRCGSLLGTGGVSGPYDPDGPTCPTVTVPDEACAIVPASPDAWVYPDGNQIFDSFASLPYDPADFYPPDAATPGGGAGWIDWLYETCPSCTECD